ncbi:MAG: hypothetical protein V2A67_11650, partial [Bacteroidota bacterium]
MKTPIKTFAILIMVLTAFQGIPAQGKTGSGIEKTIVREKAIVPAAIIKFENSIGPLTVATWNKQLNVKIETVVSIDGEQDDVNKTLAAIENIDFIVSGITVTFETKFYDEMRSERPGKITLKLPDQSTVKLSKLSISYRLTVPENQSLDLTNKYEDVTLPDLSGKLTLNLYEAHLTAGLITNEAKVDIKYGGGTIQSVNDIELSLYEAKLNIGHAGKMNINSKYSTLEVQEAGALQIDSYEDHITIHKQGDVNVAGKYSDISLSDFSKASVNLYECTLTAGIAGSVTAESEYSRFDIKRLDESLVFNKSYNDQIVIGLVDMGFSRIGLNGKYTSLIAPVEKGAEFKVVADLHYAGMELPDKHADLISEKKDDKWKYAGLMNGADKNTTKVVELTL